MTGAGVMVGRVLRPWGLKGAVRVEPLTHDPERFRSLRRLTVRGEDGEAAYEVADCAVDASGFVRLVLAGIATVEQAERLRGASLLVDDADVVRPLGPSAYFNHELLGCEVWAADGRHLGQVEEVLETGATNILVVRGAAGEYLIPAASEHLALVAPDRRRIEIAPSPGLLEINERDHAV